MHEFYAFLCAGEFQCLFNLADFLSHITQGIRVTLDSTQDGPSSFLINKIVYCALIISLLPLLLASLAPAVAIYSISIAPAPAAFFHRTYTWWLIVLIATHGLFVATNCNLVFQSWRRLNASVNAWRLSVVGFAALVAFMVIDVGTSSINALTVSGYSWPSIIFSAITLWISFPRKHAFR